MRRIAAFPSLSAVRIQTLRRTFTIRVQPNPCAPLRTFIFPRSAKSENAGVRCSCTSSALLGKEGVRSYYPYPPPPPQGAPYYGGPMMPPPPPPPMMQSGPELGTKERPLVVIASPPPNSGGMWANRLWLMLFIFIALSAALQLLDELQDRFQDNSANNMGKPPGGMGGRGALSNLFSSNEVKPVNLDSLEVTFDSIRGCDEAKKELEEIVEFLKDPKKFHELGGRLPKGALLVGPPGCGKTMLAKAIAKEAGVNFFYATGSEFDEMFVGVGARRVRELFAAAKANSPALIFIDEVDALGGKRSKSDHTYSRMTLNQLLAEMDGFQSNEEVIVLAATNTPESLDKALTRPGRLDTTIAVDPPDMKGRTEVLNIYLNRIKKDASVNAATIARGTTGFTGAELSNVVNLAAIRAAVQNKKYVSSDDVEYAVDRVMMGAESKKAIPEEERRVTAYHEGGHALIAILLEDKGAEPVHKATIVPRGNGIMGLVQQQPAKDKYSQSKKQCLSRLRVCVAGRVGEEILLGSEDVTTGAGSDFQQATRMARAMVRRFGFSDQLGLVDYDSEDSPSGAYISDETKVKIEREVERLLQEAYADASAMLKQNRTSLDRIAAHLLTHETLSGDELKRVINGETIPLKVATDTTTPPPPPVSPSANNSNSGNSNGGGNRRPVTIS